MKIKTFFIKLGALVLSFGSMIMYIFFQKKQNQKLAKKIDDYEQQSEQLAEAAKQNAEQSEKLLNAIKENSEVEKNYEKELQKASDNHLDGFNASLDLLRK